MAAWITNRSAVDCYSAIELMLFIGLIDWSQRILFLLLKKQNFPAKKKTMYKYLYLRRSDVRLFLSGNSYLCHRGNVDLCTFGRPSYRAAGSLTLRGISGLCCCEMSNPILC